MAGLQDLTDEELMLMAQESGIEAQPKQGLGALSDDELLALANESGVTTEAKKPEPVVSTVTSAESAVRGATQGLTLGFADEISGAIESTLTDKPFEQARNESRQNFARAQEENPNAYIMGEVAGGIGGAFASGGLSAGYRGAAIVGGLAGVGFSNRTGSDLIKDAAIGSAFGIGGEAAAKGIGRYIQRMFQNSSKVTKEVFSELGETTRPENVKFEADLMKDAFNGRLGSADQWVASKNFGTKAQLGLDETPKLIRDIFKDKLKQIGGQIQAVVDNLDVKSVDVSDLIDVFKTGAKDTLRKSGSDVGALKIIQREILDKIDDGTFSAFGENIVDINNLTPTQATEFKRAVQEIVFSEMTPNGEVNLLKNSPRANKLLEQLGAGITERANALDPSGSLKALNQQYSQLMQAQQLIPRKEESFKLLKLQDAIGPNATAGEMRTFNQLLEGVDPEFRAKLIKEVNPRLSAFKLHQAATFQGGAVSTAFRAKAGASAGSGLGVLGETAGFIIGAGEAATVNVANALAKGRAKFKVPRNLAGVFQNSDMIVSKLSQVNPTLAITLNDLIANGDKNAVEEFMKQALQDPATNAEFEDGVGFEGKAVTKEEIAQVHSQIMASRAPLRSKIKDRKSVV